MDSLTQFALGACVARAAAPSVSSPRLLAWGGVLATLPDLDSLFIGGDALSVISQHRSWSHSLLTMALATPLFAAAMGRLGSFSTLTFVRRCLLVYAVFVTHVILDAMTVYGTQLLWPLDRTPYAASLVFIIDPLYTLPLVVAAVAAIRFRAQPARGARAVHWGLALSAAYLALALGAKIHVGNVASQWRQELGLDRAAPVLTVPMPFNIVLWRVLIMAPDSYYEGLVGLFDNGMSPPPTRFDRGAGHPLSAQGVSNLQRVMKFTGPYYRLIEDNGRLAAEDLRMGLDPDYVFRFVVQRRTGPVSNSVDTLPANTSLRRAGRLWPRLWDPEAPPP